MSYLFWSQGHYRPPTNGRQRLKLEQADKTVLADFATLQSVWRRQDTLRSTFKRIPSSREERQAWKHLIEYLTRLSPPEG